MAETQFPEDIAAHLADLPPGKQAAAQTLLDLMARATGETPQLWRGGIVGFGTYHYRYATGREGDAPAAGFAMRKAATTVYLLDGVAAHQTRLSALGPHTAGVGCVYLRSLDAVDLKVLEDLVGDSYRTLMGGTDGNRPRDGLDRQMTPGADGHPG